jgi:hypothetical protein
MVYDNINRNNITYEQGMELIEDKGFATGKKPEKRDPNAIYKNDYAYVEKNIAEITYALASPELDLSAQRNILMNAMIKAKDVKLLPYERNRLNDFINQKTEDLYRPVTAVDKSINSLVANVKSFIDSDVGENTFSTYKMRANADTLFNKMYNQANEEINELVRNKTAVSPFDKLEVMEKYFGEKGLFYNEYMKKQFSNEDAEIYNRSTYSSYYSNFLSQPFGRSQYMNSINELAWKEIERYGGYLIENYEEYTRDPKFRKILKSDLGLPQDTHPAEVLKYTPAVYLNR